MPTKCFTKATKQGKKYTACVDTKTFKKKGVKGNAKSKKPTAKGIMVVRKKRKIKKRFKTKRLTEMAKKSTITPPLTQSRRRPDGYKKEGNKMSAGMSMLMTSGLMNRVSGFALTRKEKLRRSKIGGWRKGYKNSEIAIFGKELRRHPETGEIMFEKKPPPTTRKPPPTTRKPRQAARKPYQNISLGGFSATRGGILGIAGFRRG